MKIKVTQVCRATREIEVEVEATSLEEARDMVLTGEIDAPDFEDPKWVTHWDLMNEEVDAA